MDEMSKADHLLVLDNHQVNGVLVLLRTNLHKGNLPGHHDTNRLSYLIAGTNGTTINIRIR